jgi:hypothetical protein
LLKTTGIVLSLSLVRQYIMSRRGKSIMNTNITSNNLIGITFTGENIRPDTVKASELAEILRAVETMVESHVLRDHPEVQKEVVVVGLVKIKASSLDLQFSSEIPAWAIAAFQDTGQAVNDQDFSRLPSDTFDALDTLVSFTRKRQCIAKFITLNGKKDVIATITPEIEIRRKPLLTGETTIYGQVVRVGGRTPRVMLEMVDGQTIYCDATADMARTLGGKLYQVVGLIGIAQWNPETLVMNTFEIKAILPYEAGSFKEAMAQLAEMTKSYYADITDVPEYIANIRGGSEVDSQ